MRFLAESASRPGGSSKPSSEGFLLFDHSDPKLLPLTVSFSWHLYPEDTSSQSQLRTRPREKPEHFAPHLMCHGTRASNRNNQKSIQRPDHLRFAISHRKFVSPP